MKIQIKIIEENSKKQKECKKPKKKILNKLHDMFKQALGSKDYIKMLMVDLMIKEHRRKWLNNKAAKEISMHFTPAADLFIKQLLEGGLIKVNHTND